MTRHEPVAPPSDQAFFAAMVDDSLRLAGEPLVGLRADEFDLKVQAGHDVDPVLDLAADRQHLVHAVAEKLGARRPTIV